MGVVIRTDRLRQELVRRGWAGADLAHAAGISAPTVTAALAGRPLSPRTVGRIVQALALAPVLEGIDGLV